MAKKEVVPTTKSGIMAALAEAAGISKKQAVLVYEKLLDLAIKGAKQEEKGFMIPGLGKLRIKKQGARTVRNPQTGATIKKPACKVAKFRLAKAAKDAVLAKSLANASLGCKEEARIAGSLFFSGCPQTRLLRRFPNLRSVSRRSGGKMV